MSTVSSVAEVARLVGEPARTSMLFALMDGRALTAWELANVAGISPSTASGHLAAMVTAGLLTLRSRGRHRYHALASADVASMLEMLMGIAARNHPYPHRNIRTGPRDQALRRARTCYNHLAGALAVSIADAMLGRGQLVLAGEGAVLTDKGLNFLQMLNVDLRNTNARFASDGAIYCKPCLDWSERRMHIGGAVGASLYQMMLARHWLRRKTDSRAVEIISAGEGFFRAHFGVDDVAQAPLESFSVPAAATA